MKWHATISQSFIGYIAVEALINKSPYVGNPPKVIDLLSSNHQKIAKPQPFLQQSHEIQN